MTRWRWRRASERAHASCENEGGPHRSDWANWGCASAPYRRVTSPISTRSGRRPASAVRIRHGGATATTPLRACDTRHFPSALALLLLFAGCDAPAADAHPLAPLSAAEIETAVDTLRAAGDVDATTRYALIDLDEPAKHEVLAWRPGQDLPRKAFIIARRDRVVDEGVVDLGRRRVERWRAVPHVETLIPPEGWRQRAALRSILC